MNLEVEQLKAELVNAKTVLEVEKEKYRMLELECDELTRLLGIQMRYTKRLLKRLEGIDD